MSPFPKKMVKYASKLFFTVFSENTARFEKIVELKNTFSTELSLL